MNTVSRIYLGRNIGSQGLTVTDSQFEEFLQKIVVPSFDGFTILSGYGFWKGLAEEVQIIEVIHEGGEKAAALVEFITQTYAARFSQDCVLVTTGKVELDFVSTP